jgi:hypothetical protein
MHPHGERLAAHHEASRFLGGWSRAFFFEEGQGLGE